MRFHDLRHTWATYVGMSGVPLEALRSAGGWSNLTLVGHYARCGDEATMAAWREALGGLS